MTAPLLLVMEDDPMLGDSIAEILESDGFRVVLARNGEQGWAKLESGERPAVIVLDLMMPRVSGLDFRRRQLASAFAEIPVIVTTASPRNPDLRDPAFGDCPCLIKPFDVDALLAEITRKLSAPAG
jgi:two-component system OmpR family response regulator/two-component system phosphate regulon response regulator OmpR